MWVGNFDRQGVVSVFGSASRVRVEVLTRMKYSMAEYFAPLVVLQSGDD